MHKSFVCLIFVLCGANNTSFSQPILTKGDCEMICNYGSLVLFSVTKICYPTAFILDSMSATDKLIYGACESADVLNVVSVSFSASRLPGDDYTCQSWAQMKIEETNAPSICECGRQKRGLGQIITNTAKTGLEKLHTFETDVATLPKQK